MTVENEERKALRKISRKESGNTIPKNPNTVTAADLHSDKWSCVITLSVKESGFTWSVWMRKNCQKSGFVATVEANLKSN